MGNNSNHKTKSFDFERFNRSHNFNDFKALLERSGWRCTGGNKFTRPGKSTGTSAVLCEHNGQCFLKNFSSSVDLSRAKNGTVSYSNYLLETCYNGDFKRFFDDYGDNYNNTCLPSNKSTVPPQQAPKPFRIEASEPLIYDYPINLPEFVSDVQDLYIADGLTSKQARDIVLEGADFLKSRIYRVAINRYIKNKNQNLQGEPNRDFRSLTFGFQNFELTRDRLINAIRKGFAFCGCQFQTDGTGRIHRKNDNFLKSELLILDIDNGLRIENCLKMPETKKAQFIYTTCSHTPENHRYRLVFTLPYVCSDPDNYKKLVNHFIEIYQADKSCTDPTRAYFGNANATVFYPNERKIELYKNGEKLNES